MEEFNFGPEQAGLERGRTVSAEDWYKLESAARRLKAKGHRCVDRSPDQQDFGDASPCHLIV